MAKRSRETVEERIQPAAKLESERDDNPLYGVAMLKVAMELKRPKAPPLDEIISGVLSKMKLSRDSFEEYLRENLGLLRALGEKEGGFR